MQERQLFNSVLLSVCMSFHRSHLHGVGVVENEIPDGPGLWLGEGVLSTVGVSAGILARSFSAPSARREKKTKINGYEVSVRQIKIIMCDKDEFIKMKSLTRQLSSDTY